MDKKYTQLKSVFKESMLEAMYEFENYRKKKNRNQDVDLISTSEAWRLRGRARVTRLIALGLLRQTTSGVGKNSVRYVSKKQLFDLDETIL